MEKHRFIVTLFDRRGRVLWISDDPSNKSGLLGTQVADTVTDADRERLVAILQNVVMRGETQKYITHAVIGLASVGLPRLQKPTPWQVTMWPLDMDEIAACAVSYPLRHDFQDFSEQDRQLLRLLSEDNNLKDIAVKMNRSVSAIDAKIKSLKKRLGVTSLSGLIAAALRQSVIE